MIDTDYQLEYVMAAAKNERAGSVTSKTDAWSPDAHPAVAKLLDHVAEELAREYVRLMERAAEDEAGRDQEAPRRKEVQR